MPVLLQVCVVLVTAAVVVVSIYLIRALSHFERVAEQLSKTADVINESMADVKRVTTEAHEIVATFSDVAPRVRSVFEHVAELGDRAVRVSSVALAEVEKPVLQAVALMRGMRSGTSYLFESLMRRMNGVAPQKERAS